MFNPIFNKRFGELVSEERRRCGYTQAQLAKKLKVSAQFFGRIEKGAKAPPKLIKKVIRILDIDEQNVCDTAFFAAGEYCTKILK